VQDTVAVFWRVVPTFLLAVGGGTLSALAGLSHERLCALISLAAGHEAGGHAQGRRMGIGVDLLLLLAVCAHKVPEGLALGALLLGGVLVHAGSGFLFLAAHAVFEELVKHGKKLVLASLAVGIPVIGVLNLTVRAL